MKELSVKTGAFATQTLLGFFGLSKQQVSLIAVLIIYVSLHTSNGLVLRSLSLSEVGTGQILFFRGMFSLFFLVGIAKGRISHLFPNNRSLALRRLLVGGAALSFATASYQFLSATSVSVIARLDVAICVLIGFFFGERLPRGRGLLTLVFAILPSIGLVWWNSCLENAVGLFCAFTSVCLLSFSYFLLKKATEGERIEAVVAVPSFAILLFGLLIVFVLPSAGSRSQLMPYVFNVWVWVQLFLSGLIMYFTYSFTAQLYQVMSVSRAEYPTLFSTLLILPAEWLLFESGFDWTFAFLVLLQIFALWFFTQQKKET